MPEIKPFKGIRYNLVKIKNLADVITQPYDQITDEMEKDYKEQSPYNFVRLVLTKYAEGHDRVKEYQDAKKFTEEWTKGTIFIQDDKVSLYPYFQEFNMGDKKYIRKGFICRVRLEELGKGILPHEKTLSKPKEDRLSLLRATKKDFEPVFLLYTDPKNYVMALIESECQKPPIVDVLDDRNVRHKIWRISDPDLIIGVTQHIKDSLFVIADGHHRYETALTYRIELGKIDKDHPANFKMIALVNIQDKGLVILPTHRLIKNLPDFKLNSFLNKAKEIFEIKETRKELLEKDLTKEKSHAFGFYNPEGSYILKLKSNRIMAELLKDRSKDYQNLDVAILHTLLIENILCIKPEKIEDHICYQRGADDTLKRIDSEEFQFCFLMNPTRVEQVRDIAQHRERMPQKSTDFYPKLISGLVFYNIA